MISLLRYISGVLVLLTVVACQQGATADDAGTWVPEVVASYPHDANAFTQGLLFHDGYLYESTGRYGQSSVRKVEIDTGRVLQLRPIESVFFGEGLALVDDRLIMLTWQSGTGFVFALADFSLQQRFSYGGEGWGLTFDGERLIMSDGTARLRFIDPVTLRVTSSVTVTEDDVPVTMLNELEYIDDEVWANVWQEDYLVRIEPGTGRVLGRIDLGVLYPVDIRDSAAVVNGIAYDAGRDRIFVTGKLWPTMFEIEFRER